MNEITGPLPGQVDLTMVRGDTFERKLFQGAEYSDPDDPSSAIIPVDIRDNTYIFEVRESPFDGDACDPLMEALQSEGELYFGQSDEAIAYDIAQSNPPGTTYDELFTMVGKTKTLIEPGYWWWGVRAITSFGTSELLLQNRIRVTPDVPKLPEAD